MKQTYDEAITKVFKDEGGYTNDAADPGGPTNWGITIFDARKYWKADATAADVKKMPKSVASEIYRRHYAEPIRYDELPAGVDYAILDYGINSGISRGVKVLQKVVKIPVDGRMGPETIAAVNKLKAEDVINAIYDERLKFLKGLKTWPTFGKGWGRRCKEGRALALSLATKYKNVKPSSAGPIIAGGAIAGGAAATQAPHEYWPYIAAGIAVVLVVGVLVYWYKQRNKTNVV